METRSNMSYVYEQMQELNSRLEPLLVRADTWSTDSSAMLVDASETVVALALKAIARIKLNRYYEDSLRLLPADCFQVHESSFTVIAPFQIRRCSPRSTATSNRRVRTSINMVASTPQLLLVRVVAVTCFIVPLFRQCQVRRLHIYILDHLLRVSSASFRPSRMFQN